MKKVIFTALQRHFYLLTSLGMFLSFPSFDLPSLKAFPLFAWVSLVPLFAYVRGKTMREVFVASFITGLAGNLVTYQWIGNFGAEVSGGYTVILLFLVPALTGFFTAKILVAEYLSRRFERLRMLIYPAVWIGVDWIQSVGHLAFPWTYWGYSQYPFTALIQMASVTGVMGVTFLVVLGNCALADLWFSIPVGGASPGRLMRIPAFRRAAALGVAVALISGAGWALMRAGGSASRRDMRVAMVQSCIDPWDNWTLNRMRFLDELLKYTARAVERDPDLVIWSESATLEMLSFDYMFGRLNMFERRLFESVRGFARPLLTGEIGRTDDVMNRRAYFHNSAVLIDAQGCVVRAYPKINLVPFGEWFPYERWLPWVSRLTQSFGASSFYPGTVPVRFELGGRRFGVLICYEGIFFRLCREYKKLGVDFLVNITNDGWTHTYNGHMQHYAAAKFRAIENGVWFLRAGNTGYTVIIDPYGRETASIPILRQGFLTGDIDFSLNRRTLYSRAGDAFFYAAMLFLLGLVLYSAAHAVRKRPSGR